MTDEDYDSPRLAVATIWLRWTFMCLDDYVALRRWQV